jgi:hypothetical protein
MNRTYATYFETTAIGSVSNLLSDKALLNATMGLLENLASQTVFAISAGLFYQARALSCSIKNGKQVLLLPWEAQVRQQEENHA